MNRSELFITVRENKSEQSYRLKSDLNLIEAIVLPEVDFQFVFLFACSDAPSDLIGFVIGLFFERRPTRRLLCLCLDPSFQYRRSDHRRKENHF